MTIFTSQQLADISEAKLIGPGHIQVEEILTDSRHYKAGGNKAFVALAGKRHNGHDYIEELYQNDIRIFIISEFRAAFKQFPEAAFILCKNSLEALQKIAAFVRNSFDGRVTALTGSNGKTSVKEWLFHLLKFNNEIIRSPKSYNSQIGVALSLLLLENRYDAALIEAGISLPGEMERLEKIIQPDIGIFTGLGDAHRENFESAEEKLSEKLKLFKNVQLLICQSHDAKVLKQIQEELPDTRIFSWGENETDNLKIFFQPQKKGTDIQLEYAGKTMLFRMHQKDRASQINIGHCLAYLISQNQINDVPAEAFEKLPNIEMRLEQIEGINACTIINDSYNSDINALSIALDLLKNQTPQQKKSLILSDIKQCRRHKDQLYRQVADMIHAAGISRFIGIGPELSKRSPYFSDIANTAFFTDTASFLKQFKEKEFKNEAILLKAAREFTFELISRKLQQKKHQTQLVINLEAMVHNLNYFKSKLPKETRIMAMVKAFSYGSGSHEIATLLRHQQIDYLAAAVTDEGIRLRREGIRLPVMIMNPEFDSLEMLPEYRLEPEIYSFEILREFARKIRMYTNMQHGIHLKINTGMNRLGFDAAETDQLIALLKSIKNIRIQSIFSHLAAADDPLHDAFTREQIRLFNQISSRIQVAFPYKILRHIANSSGTERFPEACFDMVRLGIGLYGFSANNQDKLQNVSSLVSHISQIREVPADATVGYSRAGKLKRDSRIAIVPVGYADGLRRSLSRGKWAFLVRGQKAPIVGNICMDMCMIDITDIPAQTGDIVIIFGDSQPADHMAKVLHTIPYEIITGIGDRVKRVYYY